MLIQSQLNYDYKKSSFTKIKAKSLTIPNETYTIRELFKKHSLNLMPPDIERRGQWAENVDFDSIDYEQFNRMGIGEKHEFKLEHNKRVEALQNLLKEQTEAERRKTESKQMAGEAQDNQTKPFAPGQPPAPSGQESAKQTTNSLKTERDSEIKKG